MDTDIAAAQASLPLWSEEPSSRPDRARMRARIGGLHCSLCTGTIEKVLGRQPGVDNVAVSLTHEQALIEFDPRLVRPEHLLQTLRDIGYTVHDPRKFRVVDEEERELVREGRRFLVATAFSLTAISLISDPASICSVALPIVATVSFAVFVFLVLSARGRWHAVVGVTGIAFLVGGIQFLKGAGYLAGLTPWLAGLLAIVLVFCVARHILRMAFHAIRRGILNQHVLLEAGAFGGLAGGLIGLVLATPTYPTAHFFAVSVMVVTYHVFSEWLSLIVKTRSTQAVKRLLDLRPDTAHVVRDGFEVELPVEAVIVGELVRIRPGARIPVDGTVIEGQSYVDMSLVTGEPMPIERKCGDTVIGGAMNGTGALLVLVTAVGETSFLLRVVREVEDARALKPGILHLVDRVLRIYTPAVLTIALIAFGGWIFLPYVIGLGGDLQRAVFAGLSVLVMGYPCAVGISAPLSLVRGAGEAAESGILMRTGEAFQAYRLVDQIAFDKTGTLTEGRPRVHEIEAFNADADALLTLAAAVEGSSEHPLAAAIVGAAFDKRLEVPVAERFEAVSGKGVMALVGGAEVRIGSPRFLVEGGIDLSQLENRIDALEDAGRTVIVIARDGRAIGLLAAGDALRSDAVGTIAAFHASGVRTMLITGDNKRTAERIAFALGIDTVHAGVLPGEKAALIRSLQSGGKVAMVGDGINDAPALMQADVGIAMGGGTDIAIDSADIIILNNRLQCVFTAKNVSRRAYRRMKQNLSLAVLFNGIGIPLAASGLVYPVWAMAAMAASVTAIFLNSLWGRPSLFFHAILRADPRS